MDWAKGICNKLPGMLSVLDMTDADESRESLLLWILALRATLEISARVDSISFFWTGPECPPEPDCSTDVTWGEKKVSYHLDHFVIF